MSKQDIVYGTNLLLKQIERCCPIKDGKIIFTDEEIKYLSRLYQDEDSPRQVQKRAQFKLALIWKEKDRRHEIAQKAQKTREKNKAANAIGSGSFDPNSVKSRIDAVAIKRDLVEDNRFWPFVGGVK